MDGDKLFWLDTFVNVALNELDFIEINCNHFLPHDVDTDLIPWSHWPVEMGYFGDREFAHWMMNLYYQILNCRLTLPLSGGSASGVKATPVGHDRVYACLEKQPFTYDNFMRALSFSTNGPVIDFKVNGSVGPGSRVTLHPGQPAAIECQVRSRKGLQQVEVLVNGRVWHSYDPGDRKECSTRCAFVPKGSTHIYWAIGVPHHLVDTICQVRVAGLLICAATNLLCDEFITQLGGSLYL